MKYLCWIENIRTNRRDAIIIFDRVEPGTVIGWGVDGHDPEVTALWTVQSCEPMK